MIDGKRKAFFYKRANFTTPIDGETLQSLLTSVLKTHKYPARRKENPINDGKTFHFINYNKNHGLPGKPSNFLGVEFFSYVQGANQSTFSLDENKTELSVESLLPPKKDDQFLEGALYFGVLGNDVTLMQSSALRSFDLERHINWLLRCYSAVEEGNIVHLDDAFPSKKLKSYKDAKAIVLSAPIEFDSTIEGKTLAHHIPELESKNIQLKPKGAGWKAIQAMLGDWFDVPKTLNSEDILKSHSLKVELQLKWERTPAGDASELLTSIAHNLRNVNEELDYKIKTKNGDITNKEFKITAPFVIPWKDGRPALDVLFPRMLEWLDSLKNSGRIDT